MCNFHMRLHSPINLCVMWMFRLNHNSKYVEENEVVSLLSPLRCISLTSSQLFMLWFTQVWTWTHHHPRQVRACLGGVEKRFYWKGEGFSLLQNCIGKPNSSICTAVQKTLIVEFSSVFNLFIAYKPYTRIKELKDEFIKLV